MSTIRRSLHNVALTISHHKNIVQRENRRTVLNHFVDWIQLILNGFIHFSSGNWFVLPCLYHSKTIPTFCSSIKLEKLLIHKKNFERYIWLKLKFNLVPVHNWNETSLFITNIYSLVIF